MKTISQLYIERVSHIFAHHEPDGRIYRLRYKHTPGTLRFRTPCRWRCDCCSDAVCNGSVENAFALVRPPGHHARAGMGAGFCYLNNMAIMVRRIQKNGYKQVMILDWDAHHGDGTQDIFYKDSSVLFSSIHQSPFYPGSGYISETGCGEGEGYTVNMPVPAGTTDDSYRYLFEQVIEPLACEFCPDSTVSPDRTSLHRSLTACVTAGGYAEMMQRAVDLSKISAVEDSSTSSKEDIVSRQVFLHEPRRYRSNGGMTGRIRERGHTNSSFHRPLIPPYTACHDMTATFQIFSEILKCFRI